MEFNDRFNVNDIVGNFSSTIERKAMEALQFYEDCADHIAYCEASGRELGFDWDMCRAYCFMGKSYSHSRFMHYVAEFFGTTVGEMKSIKNK